MATTAATSQGLPVAPDAAVPPATTTNRLRFWLVRMTATAYLIAGAVMALSVLGNLALGLNYTGGPMGYYGSRSVGLAGYLHTLTHLRVWDASQFWALFGSYSLAFSRKAQTSPTFFTLMACVYIGFAGLWIAIGYGLWRRLPRARAAALVTLGVSAGAAATHGVVLLASGFSRAGEGLEILAITAVVAGPILYLLGSTGTAALFHPSASTEPSVARERRWWTLSLQWLAGALAIILAFGLVQLLTLGPLVEVVWAGILVAEPGPGS